MSVYKEDLRVIILERDVIIDMGHLYRLIENNIDQLFIEKNGVRDGEEEQEMKMIKSEYKMNKESMLVLSLIFSQNFHKSLKILELGEIRILGNDPVNELTMIIEDGNDCIVDYKRWYCSCDEFTRSLFTQVNKEEKVYCCHLLALSIQHRHYDKFVLDNMPTPVVFADRLSYINATTSCV